MATAMTVKGQVTIPKAVRDAAGIKPGDKVTAEALPDGRIVLTHADQAARRADITAQIDAVAQRTQGTTNWPGKTTDDIMQFLRGDD